jgi:CHASE2 domain-containing sensor protein
VRTQRRVRLLIAATVGAVAVAITLGAYAAHVLRTLELRTVDARFSMRGATGTPKEVVLVAIDDNTFSDLRHASGPNKGKQVHWPFPRRYFAAVMNRIEAAGPRALAVDVQFTEPTTVVDDNALIQAAQRAGHPVFSATEFTDDGRANIFGGAYDQFGVVAGNTNVINDADGSVRRMFYEDQGVTGFAVAAAEQFLGHAVRRLETQAPYIDYVGPPGTIKTYSFSDVYYGQVPRSAFAGKLVVIGPTATSLQDRHSTSASGSEKMAGGEVQANAAYTAIRGFPLRGVWRGWGIVLIVAFGLLAPVASLRMRGWRAPALALVVGVLFAVAVQLAFNQGRIVLFTYPLLALVLSSIGVLVSEYLLEAFERVRRRPGARAHRRRAAPRRRARHGHGDVHRPARFHDFLRGPRRRGGDRPAERLPWRDQRRCARARRHARLLPR